MSAVPITVNGVARVLEEPGLPALLRELGLAERKGIAVAVNGSVVPRSDWPKAALAAKDAVLIIRATQGG